MKSLLILRANNLILLLSNWKVASDAILSICNDGRAKNANDLLIKMSFFFFFCKIHVTRILFILWRHTHKMCAFSRDLHHRTFIIMICPTDHKKKKNIKIQRNHWQFSSSHAHFQFVNKWQIKRVMKKRRCLQRH